MTILCATNFKNLLLRMMSEEDFSLLGPHLTRCALPVRMNLEHAQSPRTHLYFLESGIASIVATLPQGRDTEIGMIGYEGVTGGALAMGDQLAVHDCFMQVAGEAMRIDARSLANVLAESLSLRLFLLLYVRSLNIQTSATALVNARSKLESRLCRWLLMCDDRMPSGKLAITHEYLAVMLGVRRPGVTVALQLLEGQGLIRSTRGQVVIRSRDGLVKAAGGGYGAPEAEYLRLVGCGSEQAHNRSFTARAVAI
jgi:CRP-like cAMP-binding protein